MELIQIAKLVDLFASATVVGATLWFFFVQSPALLRKLGREQFVPIQMRLTVVLFRMLQVLLIVGAAAAALHSGLASAVTVAAALGLAAGLVNTHLIVPRALRAGGRSRVDIKGKDVEGSVAGFASKGAGDRTKLLHRTVVVFVVVMLAGVGLHLAALVVG